MRALLTAVLATTTMMSTGVPAVPVDLPAGPLVLAGETAEQYSSSNDINNLANPGRAGMVEGNWGIMQISSVSIGIALSPRGSDVGVSGPIIFSDGQNGGQQILGIFYGIMNNPGGPAATSTGGVLDLYFWDNNNQDIDTPFVRANLSRRGQGGSQSGNAEGAYSGFTCPSNTPGCYFLARLKFTPGADVNSQTNTIYAPAGAPTFDSYLSVDTTTIGTWTNILDSNFFTLNPANQVCKEPAVSCISPNDMRVDGTYTNSGAQAWDIENTDIIGLNKNISSRISVVPEPNSLALMVIGLAWTAAGIRRRKWVR